MTEGTSGRRSFWYSNRGSHTTVLRYSEWRSVGIVFTDVLSILYPSSSKPQRLVISWSLANFQSWLWQVPDLKSGHPQMELLDGFEKAVEIPSPEMMMSAWKTSDYYCG